MDKKKPKGIPFKKGFDPRRKVGRRKQGETLAQRVRDAMSEPLFEGSDYTKFDGIMDALMEKALDGDVPAIEYLHSRGWGRMANLVEINVSQKLDLSRLTAEEYETYKVLFFKMTKKEEEYVDGHLLSE